MRRKGLNRVINALRELGVGESYWVECAREESSKVRRYPHQVRLEDLAAGREVKVYNTKAHWAISKPEADNPVFLMQITRRA